MLSTVSSCLTRPVGEVSVVYVEHTCLLDVKDCTNKNDRSIGVISDFHQVIDGNGVSGCNHRGRTLLAESNSATPSPDRLSGSHHLVTTPFILTAVLTNAGTLTLDRRRGTIQSARTAPRRAPQSRSADHSIRHGMCRAIQVLSSSYSRSPIADSVDIYPCR